MATLSDPTAADLLPSSWKWKATNATSAAALSTDRVMFISGTFAGMAYRRVICEEKYCSLHANLEDE